MPRPAAVKSRRAPKTAPGELSGLSASIVATLKERIVGWHYPPEHRLIDLGDDVFTRGRPHRMIDHRLRNERILKEAADREVAVILLDVVLGHGAHADPAAQMAPAIAAARSRAAKNKRRIAFVGFICGTSADPQGLAGQQSVLTKAGMLLAPSNAQAVRPAAGIAARGSSVAARGSPPPHLWWTGCTSPATAKPMRSPIPWR